MAADIDLDLARNKAIAAARDLHNKLALTMTYSEFDKGFHEWAALGDALMAVAAAREKVSNA